jgi:hypothetical protein
MESHPADVHEGAQNADHADIDRDLLTRIRMEYLEMPDLRLTNRQARRLWNLEQAACDAILAALVRDHFLSQTVDGSYVVVR